jgi:hypothetical protein
MSMSRFLMGCLIVMSLCACVTTADERSSNAPVDGTKWARLHPSNPEHAAIAAWHRALVSNDYEAYLRATGGPTPGLSDRDMRTLFDNMSQSTPSTILIAAEPHHVNPSGTNDYFVAGCRYGARLIAGVTPRQVDGKWTASGTGFAAPWNHLARVCPQATRESDTK